MAKYDVFISYSRKDKVIADKLCKEFDKEGIIYWIDRNLYGSSNFITEIANNILDSHIVVFIASHHSASSQWTQKEILFAQKKQQKNNSLPS
ncbi:MAG: toll/interleukin-1 receptor domain-containing protein [Bacteroidaceae bacterium]|nr:toll/interleukin-1 receptor domain-containing protein [Bacteroidaceae bacterium]